MKVSVIIPFHKGISFLEDCLQSLVDQSYRDMEIILVLDHAQEKLDTFIKPYQTSLQIKVIQSENKAGVAAARNLGLSAAAGEYIYFLDSDDYLGSTTLELLAQVADNNHADVIYGKKLWTWFKRSIYMSKLVNHDNDAEEEDEDEENNSGDTVEANLENGGEAESRSSISDDQLLNDGLEEEDKNQNIDRIMDAEAKKRAAYYHLVSHRKGVRNISILNILIKRTIIEENKIRFNEDITYLSDYPFVLQVLNTAASFEYLPLAAYIKRNHNDSVNMPSLSQMKGSKSFAEYVDTYRYAISLISQDCDLRGILDKKIIFYCIRYFAPKLRRSKDQADTENKFRVMHQIISNMNKELLKNKNRYKRKLLHAFYTGDIRRAKIIVNRHLAWIKLKKITKNKKALAKFLYIHSFSKKPLKENWVICESFFGKSYSDSPKYIYEYISKNYPGKYRFIWVVDKKHTKIPYKHTKIKRFGIRYAYYMARCKYYVLNVRQPGYVKKREGNVFLETWHGTPLKKLGFDIEDISSASPKYKQQLFKQSKAWDYMIAPNQFSGDIFRRCFVFNQEMLNTGYPRNDIMHYDNRDQLAVQMREKLGIPKNKKTILYAPTWRDDEFYTKGKYKFTLKLDLQLLKEKLGKDYVILLRTHYYIADSLDVTGLEDFAYNLSKYDDISELYLISDILITDYSSVFFDYANLKRPMLFFTYDLEKYRDILRGFYIDIEEELPGPLLYTTEEVVEGINNINAITEKYHDKYVKFYDKYCSWEDGNASRKVANKVFGLK
jgi:Putative glycosyl/glycerophosphate transferases involved in teichoic acid biosynthesis TagF/TagB/EpsJ/RodC